MGAPVLLSYKHVWWEQATSTESAHEPTGCATRCTCCSSVFTGSFNGLAFFWVRVRNSSALEKQVSKKRRPQANSLVSYISLRIPWDCQRFGDCRQDAASLV